MCLRYGSYRGTPAPVCPQEANIRVLNFYAVKQDRVADFRAAIKEYIAILKKAGGTHYASVWLSLTGPSEYMRVDHYSKWADVDSISPETSPGASRRFTRLKKPPYTSKYVRWCGRTGS